MAGAALILGPASAPDAAAADRRAAAAAARRDPAALEAARRFLCPHGGTPVRGQRGRCRPGGGTAGLAGADPAVRGWDAGLPPPQAGGQTACPEGFVAVAPVARSDARRCVPN